MPINLAMSRLFTRHFYPILNISIIFLTFIESYIFPFAIIKWMVVLTKYGGLLKLLSSDKAEAKKLQCTRYKYELQLMTMCKGDMVDFNEVSHVSMMMESDGIQVCYIIISHIYCST